MILNILYYGVYSIRNSGIAEKPISVFSFEKYRDKGGEVETEKSFSKIDKKGKKQE